jgi:hypothetical protein
VSKGQRGKLLNPWSEAAIRPTAEKTASDKFTSPPAPGLLHLNSVLLADGLAAQGRPSTSETPYADPEDWVFASPRMKGKKPYWGNTLVANHLRVAAEQAGITGTVGWHTFRRSISTWLIDNDENVKVTQELMRHSHSKTTLDIYAKAVTPSKRRAHERIVDGLLAASNRNVGIDGQAEIATVG